ncbi:hypothetical protein NS228_20515 [Methylobacterium indicum]|nr:hypothetical protein NS228_20515 [Methylobacterium indicum]KTS41587.1 hypothetical protein NS230_28410 [Methylobacterium indicum]
MFDPDAGRPSRQDRERQEAAMPGGEPRRLRLVDDRQGGDGERPLPGEAGRQRLAALRGQLRNHLAALRQDPIDAGPRASPEEAETAAMLRRLAAEVTQLAEGWDRLAAAVSALSAGDEVPPEE